jgi:hypothetical protein
MIKLAVLLAIAWGTWYGAAQSYRAGHCVQMFGHWFDTGRTTPALFGYRLFCQ